MSGGHYRCMCVSYNNGSPVRRAATAQGVSSAANQRLAAWADDTPAISVNVQRQPGDDERMAYPHRQRSQAQRQ